VRSTFRSHWRACSLAAARSSPCHRPC
jgi:hypothetical protein